MYKEDKMRFIDSQINHFKKINELYSQLNDIDVSLVKLYPITIVKDNVFFVFDLDENGKEYDFILEYKSPINVGNRVLATFPLEFYNMKPSAIVSEDVFNNIEGYVFIFHEFVYCFQLEDCEREIRENLEIERISKESNNYMWEITHPFPYENTIFIQKTIELICGTH